jgi:hypothetical protein
MFDLVVVSDAVRKQVEEKVSLDGARAGSTDRRASNAAPAGQEGSLARLVARRRERRQRPCVETATR